MLRPALPLPLALSLSLAFVGCKSESLPPELVDSDGDMIPDQTEDRNRNGRVDPGETDPTLEDTDGDGIPDDQEVSTQACGPQNDRPFGVYDLPGADSALLYDAKVSVRQMLRTSDGKAPGGVFYDPERQVAAAVVSKRPASGAATPSAQRDHERRTVIAELGRIDGQSTRAFTTAQGYAAEQAVFHLRAAAETSAASMANELASRLLNGVRLEGTLAEQGATGRDVVVQLLTVYRDARRVVLVAAVAVGDPPTGDQLIRVDEFTDGTNLARRLSFTRHVCDEFIAEEQLKADILWVIDDSGSMEDDQMAVRAAADAMAEVLGSAQVDYRLGVARTYAPERVHPLRGTLEGRGLTRDLDRFRQDVVVGARGGWEPGLETGLEAIDRLSPPTAAGAPEEARSLRADAATIVIHMSDERDQTVECAACGTCERFEGEPEFCSDPAGQVVIDRFIAEYRSRGAVTFALVGDLPNGCSQGGGRENFEPGQGYVEVANATGGAFGSLCGDMQQNLRDVARAASGVASAYQLSAIPASATIKVVIGPPGMGREVPRSQDDGFDYDAVQNKIVFYGASRPAKDDEVVFGYRRWDWAANPATPGDPCDLCEVGMGCDPILDVSLCTTPCGEETCDPGYACLPETANCGDPADVPVGGDPCGECDAGLVCNPSTEDCVPPCDETGCDPGQFCSASTRLCQTPNF